jgi:Ca2+-binding EF-hand superfamily protein
MISGLSSSSSTSLEQMRQMQLSKLKTTDTNSDGAIDKAEFVASAPKGVNADQAASIFDVLDSKGAGSLSISDLQNSFQSMSGDMQSVLLQQQASTSSMSSKSGGRSGGSIQDMLANLDADEDGMISRDEFVSGRPDDVSEDMAGSLFDSMDSEDSGSMSIDDLSSAMAQNGPPMGPPPAGGPPSGGIASSDDDNDDEDDDDDDATSATETDTTSLLLDALDKAAEDTASTSTQTTSTTKGDALANQNALLAAMKTAMSASYGSMARSAANSSTYMAA